MKKFKIDVIRSDTFEVEIDENIITREYLNELEKSFWPIKDQEQYAKDLAGYLARFGSNDNKMIEGYGYVKTLHKDGSFILKYKPGSWDVISEDKYQKGIKVRVISEDEEIDFEIEEIKETSDEKSDVQI